MADLSRLIVAGNQAANACDAAPLMVRPYLKPLREFVTEALAAIREINAQSAGGTAGGDQQKEP